MPSGVYARELKVCLIENCGKKHSAMGFCQAHYYSHRKYGDPLKASSNNKTFNRDSESYIECARCNLSKPASEYRYRSAYDGYYETVCKKCNQKATKEWKQANAEQVALAQKRQRAKAYGPGGLEIFNRIEAGEGCENCGSMSNLHIDHDHQTGKVRGLLCSKCNTALGLLNEDPDVLLGLLAYLQHHQS